MEKKKTDTVLDIWGVGRALPCGREGESEWRRGAATIAPRRGGGGSCRVRRGGGGIFSEFEFLDAA